MADAPALQAQLTAIEAAIATGAMRVSYDGKSVEYRSLSEMRSVRDGLKRQLGLAVASRRTVAGYSNGIR